MLRTVFILAATVGAVTNAQPPAILQNGVSNSASRLPTTLPGAFLAPGARFTIRGVRLGSDVNIGGVRAHVLNATPQEVEAVVPPDIPPRETSIVVTRNGESSLPFPVRIAPSAPGLYSRNGLGWGPASIERVAGGAWAVRATGLGRATRLQLFVGERPASIRSAAGDRIVFTLPGNVPNGCFVPLYARTGEITSNVVTMTVGRCVTPGPRAAKVLLWRLSMLLEFRPGDPEPGIEEGADASFLSLSTPSVLPIDLTPPSGTCVGIAGIYQHGDTVLDWLLDATGANALDAGPRLAVEGAHGKRSIGAAAPGFYRMRPTRIEASDFFPPGQYRVSGQGGKDVGAFTATVRAREPLLWKNRDQLAVIDRSVGATVEWTGADPSRPLLVVAASADRQTTASWVCQCTAAPGATRFSLPPALLSNLPITRPAAGIPVSLLVVVQSPTGSEIPLHANGLDRGTLRFMGGSGRSVNYR